MVVRFWYNQKMKNDDYVAGRIVWRADRCDMFSDNRILSLVNSPRKKDLDFPLDFEGFPVLWAKDSGEEWTLLTSRQVVSNYGGGVVSAFYDSLGGKMHPMLDGQIVAPGYGISAKESWRMRESVRFLRLIDINIDIWMPSWQLVISLGNILKMFPMK